MLFDCLKHAMLDRKNASAGQSRHAHHGRANGGSVKEKHNDITNRALLSLPPASLSHIRGALEPVNLRRAQVIAHTDRPLKEVYFINKGMISVVKTMADGRMVEISAIGIEGMTSAITFVGFDNIVPEDVVLIPGSAFRMSRDDAMQAMEKDEAFHQMVHRQARFALGQLAQTAACNRLHHLEERCCALEARRPFRRSAKADAFVPPVFRRPFSYARCICAPAMGGHRVGLTGVRRALSWPSNRAHNRSQKSAGINS
jgi:CRP-like cAMP-binding protein